MITITTTPKLKQKAENVAKQMGTEEKKLTPTPYLQKILKDSQKRRLQGEGSPIFSSAKDALTYLHKKIDES